MGLQPPARRRSRTSGTTTLRAATCCAKLRGPRATPSWIARSTMSASIGCAAADCRRQ
jgi:hypothetical protein